MNASRRYFLQRMASAIAGSIVLPVASQAFPVKKGPGKIGVQLFSIPKITEKDFAGTMQKLAAIGFKEIEFYGPYSFSAPEDQQRWDSVTPSLGFSGSGFLWTYHQTSKKDPGRQRSVRSIDAHGFGVLKRSNRSACRSGQ